MQLPFATMAPARRRMFRGTTAVIVLAFVAIFVRLAFSELRPDPVADQSEPGPVVLVPGYGGDVDDLDPLAARLREAGRDVVVLRPSGDGTGDLRVEARRLGDVVGETLGRTGAASVDVVGYSAGGVVARLYVREEGGASVVRRVLTLGSPHHGTDVVTTIRESAGGCPTACEQLDPDSSLIARLNAGDETPAGTRWITVRTDEDTIVTPVGSAALDGALNVRVQDVCPGDDATHGRLPGDPVVLATLASALGSGAPRAPSDVRC